MRIIVLGAGVVGVSSAYYLAKDGHEVVVVDREGEVGQDASAGNAGLIAPGHSYAWASPAAPRLMLGSLTGKKTSIRVKPRLDPASSPGASGSCASAPPTVRAQHARQAPPVPVQPWPDQVDRRDRGHRLRGRGRRHVLSLRRRGRARGGLPEDGAAARERRGPAAARRRRRDRARAGAGPPARRHGRRHLRRHRRQRRLREVHEGPRRPVPCARRRLPARATVNGLRESSGTVRRSRPRTATSSAMATCSPRRRQRRHRPIVGLRVPVYPAKGYSATFPVREGGECPSVGGVDENTLVAWSKLGDVLRMSSTAEFAGYDRSWRKERLRRRARDRPPPVPECGALRPGPVSRLPAADDARRAAADRADEAAQPVAQHRARPHGLDDGAGLRQARRRRDCGGARPTSTWRACRRAELNVPADCRSGDPRPRPAAARRRVLGRPGTRLPGHRAGVAGVRAGARPARARAARARRVPAGAAAGAARRARRRPLRPAPARGRGVAGRHRGGRAARARRRQWRHRGVAALPAGAGRRRDAGVPGAGVQPPPRGERAGRRSVARHLAQLDHVADVVHLRAGAGGRAADDQRPGALYRGDGRDLDQRGASSPRCRRRSAPRTW